MLREADLAEVCTLLTWEKVRRSCRLASRKRATG